MARYTKTDKPCALSSQVCKILASLENVGPVEIKPAGVQKGVRRVQLPGRWCSDCLEIAVHDSRAELIKVSTPKPGAIRRLLGKLLSQEGIAVVI